MIEEPDRMRDVLRLAFTASRDGFMWLDERGRLLEVNPSMEVMTGRARAELLGMELAQLDEGAAAGAGALWFTQARAGSTVRAGARWRCKDGRGIEVELAVVPAPGSLGGVFVSVCDQTRRKANQEALRLSEERFEKMFRSNPDACVLSSNPDSRIAEVNEVMTRLSGYTREELVGRTTVALGLWANPAERDRYVAQVRREGRVTDFETVFRAKSGELRTCLMCTEIIQLESGPHFLSVLRDVTDRKRAEEELRRLNAELEQRVAERTAELSQEVAEHRRTTDVLREANELLVSFIRHSPIYAFVQESTATESRVLYCSDNYEQMLGRPVAAVLGRTIGELFPPELAAKIASDNWEIVRGRKIVEFTEELAGRTYHTVKFPIVQREKALLAGFTIDITERKQLEEAQRESHRQLRVALTQASELAVQAEAATAAKGRFLANMSHEIRTPLNAIIGFAQLLRNDGELSAPQRRRVETIARSGEHLLALLNDILELSKIDAGAQAVTPVTFDLWEMLNDLAMVYRQRAEAKALGFEVAGVAQVPQFIVADSRKLRRVLINLLGNAVKFTVTGEVRLQAEVAPPKGPGPRRLAVSIADSGPGIPPEERDRIFLAFGPTSAGRDGEQGTGLGLAICRQLARLMGGEVSLASTVGQGSTFRLEIPVEVGQAAAVERIDTRPVVRLAAGQPRCRVMVVDDDESSRNLLLEILGGVGFDVCTAAGGSEALGVLAGKDLRLVILDQQLGEIDGDEVIRRMRGSAEGRGLKVIMITAHATDEVRTRTMAAGADAFLAKPYRQAELFEQIKLLTGLQYVYGEPVRPAEETANLPLMLTRERLTALPEPLRQEIVAAAIRCNHDRLLALLQQVAQRDAEAGTALRAMVMRFEYERLLQLLAMDPKEASS